jgi:hypothetical protein
MESCIAHIFKITISTHPLIFKTNGLYDTMHSAYAGHEFIVFALEVGVPQRVSHSGREVAQLQSLAGISFLQAANMVISVWR